MKNYAIVLAGGSGSRMQLDIPKAFIQLDGKPLLEYCINVFSNHHDIHHIIVVVPDGYESKTLSLAKKNGLTKVIRVCTGGNNRFFSSRLGISQIDDAEAKVLIHDAARPFISEQLISESLAKLDEFDAVNLLAPVPDSLVEVHQNKITQSLDRNVIRQVQTPQAFKLSVIKKAHELALNDKLTSVADDFSLIEQYGLGSTSWIEGNRLNFKITYPEDLQLALAYIKH